MITINRVIQITQGTPPYRVIVNTTGTSTITERSNNTYEIKLMYNMEDQIGTGDSITVIDDLGCIRSIPLQITNVCENFYVSEIQRTQGFGNTVQTTLGGQSYYSITTNQAVTIEWSIDDASYYIIEPQGQSIVLTQILSGIQQTNLRATVTNTNGCTETRRFTLFPCGTFAQPSTRILRFNSDTNLYEAFRVPLRGSTSCESALIDWSTLQITNNTPATIIQRTGQPYVDITSPTPIDGLRFYFSVANNQGLRSNTSHVTLNTDNATTDIPGFTLPPEVVTVNPTTSIFSIAENNLNIRGITSINQQLTTANSASYANGIITADIIGLQSATVGLNTEQGPTALSIIRELTTYSPAPFEQVVYCNPSTEDLTDLTYVSTINNIVSGNATLVGNDLTISQNNQAVILNVTNANGQSANLTVYACGDCGTDTIVTTCETTLNLFDLLEGSPRENGTWTAVTPGAPLPANYDSSITLTGTGLRAWTYAAPSFVGEYACSTETTYTLQVTVVNATNTANNVCATPQALGAINTGGTLTSTGNITTACNNKTTWSGQTGNLIAHTYDQWFTVDSIASGTGTLRLTFTLTGTGLNPLQAPQLQLWDSCSTPLVGTLTSTLNSAILVFEKPIVGVETFLLQVLSNTTGTFTLQTVQTSF